MADMLPYLHLLQHMYPELTGAEYQRLLQDMIPNKYAQIVVLDEDKLVGLSGYRINTRLYCGKYLDIDNFIIEPAYRNKGIGKLMLDHLEAKALELGCTHAVLDAYVENHRAHRFYFREGYIIRGHHFLKKLV